MRQKKIELNNKILEVSLMEFYVNGYKDTNMRSIARKSGMTVGNIYRYFSSKQELFRNIMDPVVLKIRSIVNIEPLIQNQDIKDLNVIISLINPALQICSEHPREINIILSKSKGSIYENKYEVVKNDIASSIKKVYSEMDDELAHVIGVSIIEALLYILRNHSHDVSTIQKLFMNYLKFIFSIAFFKFRNMEEKL